MSLKHLQNIEFVVENSKHVKINESKVESVREIMKADKTNYWTKYCPAQFTDLAKEDLLKILWLFNSTSFSYWKDKPWIVDYKGNTSERGSWSNFLAIKRAMDEETPILDIRYQAEISNEELAHIYRANEEIPMLETRADFIRENAQVLIEKYQGNILNLIEDANYDAVALTKSLIDKFKSFEDSSVYKGRKVTFNKRAQLFSADVHYLIHSLSKIEELSGCADYKIPTPLEHYGVFEFSKKLKEKFENKQLITNQNIITEVRANELVAMELIAGNDYIAMESNNFLWINWQNIPKEKQNYFRFRSTGC